MARKQRIIKSDKQYKVPQIDLLTFLFGTYFVVVLELVHKQTYKRAVHAADLRVRYARAIARNMSSDSGNLNVALMLDQDADSPNP